MMENNSGLTYKVLWVEDDDDFYRAIKLIAKKDFPIQLDRYDNWDDAEKALRNDFNSYSAVILDAYCKTKGSLPPKDTFLSYAVRNIVRISGEYRSEMPWYVFSEGTMNDFGRSIENIVEGRTEEWGKMLYIKSEKDSYRLMFQNIVDVAVNQSNNVVRYRHKDVFSYLGSDGLIDDRAGKIMLRVLSALYYPEENVGFEYQGNPLRKVLEYLFRSARKQGLLSPYCFDKDDHVNLTYSSLYLKGDTVKLSGKELDVEGTIRWGNENDYVFPDNVANIIRGILVYANVDSHTYEIEDTPYLVDESSRDLFFGYVLQLCYVIKWYGEFVKDHPDVKKNQCMQVENVTYTLRATKDIEEYEGKRMVVENDGENYHCGECFLNPGYARNYLGKEITLTKVQANGNGRTKSKYPYYAEIKS